VEEHRLSPGRGAPVLHVVPDEAALARAAAAFVLSRGRRALREKGFFDLVLAGGHTPLGLYRVLGDSRLARSRLWRHARLFWGDERVVPPNDPASNYGTSWAGGLGRLAVPTARVHRVPTEGGVSRRAAVTYETELRACFAGKPWPRFDVVLLGLGTDGHVASLFPGSAALGERERWTAAAWGGTPAVDRVTLTLPALNSAAAVLFLVEGEGKSAMLARLLGPPGPDPLPAQRVRPARGELLVLADRAAAARVDTA
jgi:6-phosphogluconolactonase